MKTILHLLFFFLTSNLVMACDNDNGEEQIPVPVTVETVETTQIETNSALSGGRISGLSGEKILASGVCWSTSSEPTLADNQSEADNLDGSTTFACYLLGLEPSTTYYVRAFVTLPSGTIYGQERRFTTADNEGTGGGEEPLQTVTYLWSEGNMPATTNYTVNNGNYFDDPDFRPNMVWYPVPEGQAVKGAVMVCPGGAFMFRSDSEGTPIARRLSELGYQSFVVNYRVRPYRMEEGSLDLARAVRFVRSHASEYGIRPDNIAAVGFSAGGILCGDLALNFDGLVNGTVLDADYVADELDEVSADICSIGMIYSFYGRLSVSNNNVEELRAGNIPPTFYTYGTEDPFYRQFIANANAVREAGVPMEEHVLQDWGHGFGLGNGQWAIDFDRWLTGIMSGEE